MIVDEALERYAEEHSTPVGKLFERLAEETRASTTAPQMMVGPLEGRLLEFLVRLSGARRVLELGTFTGYSTLSIAGALPPDGRVVSCDVNAETTEVARRYLEQSGYADKVELRLGPGLEALEALEGPFDLVFIDADKENYRNYYEAVLPRLAEGGLIVVDNVLWSGRVLGDAPDDTTRAIQAFNDHVRDDERVVAVMLTVRDGMTLIRKRDGSPAG